MTQLLAKVDDLGFREEHPSDLAGRLSCRLPEMYLVVALLVCGFLCFLTPPFFVPDEVNHAKRELELGRGEVLAHKTPQGIGSAVDSNVLEVMNQSSAIQAALSVRYPRARQRPNGRITAAQLAQMQQVRWAGGRGFSTFENTALYPPFFYLPQALGWRLGEVVGAPVVKSLWLARSLAALSAVLLGWLALRLCGNDGRWTLLVCLLLPTELGLNASCSQDALLLPAACLAAVLLTRSIQCGRASSPVELACVVLLLVSWIGARLPYLPMAFAILLPVLNLPRPDTKAVWRHAVALAAILMLVGGWAGLVHHFGVLPGPGADPASQTALVLHQPLHASFNLARGTMAVVPVLAGMGLEVLGSNDVFAPAFLYVLLALGFVSVLWLAPRLQGMRDRTRGLLLAMLLGTVLLLSLSEYLIWTPVGAPVVNGLQSRYYLPLLPFTLMLPTWRRTSQARWPNPAPRLRARLLLAGTALFLFAAMATPWIAARRFYNLDLVAATRLLRLAS